MREAWGVLRDGLHQRILGTVAVCAAQLRHELSECKQKGRISHRRPCATIPPWAGVGRAACSSSRLSRWKPAAALGARHTGPADLRRLLQTWQFQALRIVPGSGALLSKLPAGSLERAQAVLLAEAIGAREGARCDSAGGCSRPAGESGIHVSGLMWPIGAAPGCSRRGFRPGLGTYSSAARGLPTGELCWVLPLLIRLCAILALTRGVLLWARLITVCRCLVLSLIRSVCMRSPSLWAIHRRA